MGFKRKRVNDDNFYCSVNCEGEVYNFSTTKGSNQNCENNDLSNISWFPLITQINSCHWLSHCTVSGHLYQAVCMPFGAKNGEKK